MRGLIRISISFLNNRLAKSPYDQNIRKYVNSNKTELSYILENQFYKGYFYKAFIRQL